jgi:hypothetical protein
VIIHPLLSVIPCEMKDEEKHANVSLDQPVSPTSSEVTTQLRDATIASDDSKFTKNEKWFIVIFTAFIGFFR